ncbi:MAG TPA: Veg family protein [Candidatus Atribacteria bacterium]|nr:Veg family protein [Candidatus Atribacteria bacterium]
MVVQNLEQIKEWVASIVGEEVVIEVNKGRKKTITKKGVIEKVYPFFFTMITDVDGSSQRASFNYADILTKTIELEITRS